MKSLFKKARHLAGATSLAHALSTGTVSAATPKDSLVVGWQFDDIITLDSAEAFEFSGSEVIGNTYDRLISYDPNDVSKIFGQAAESWTISEDGKTFTFKRESVIIPLVPSSFLTIIVDVLNVIDFSIASINFVFSSTIHAS